MIAAAALAWLLITAAPASAHDVVPGVGGSLGGLLHPVLVPAHALALTALGLLVAQQAPRHRMGLLAAFAASLGAGILVIVSAFAVADAQYAVLGVAAAAGLAVALARPLLAPVAALVGLFGGVAVELDSAPEEISMQRTFLSLVGTAVGALLVVVLVAGLAIHLRRGWQRIGVRIVGSWIAASAILVLALRLAR